MKIQIITNNKDLHLSSSVDVNTINAPMSFDKYDINIIDLTDRGLWRCDSPSLEKINDLEDFSSVGDIVSNSSKSLVLYVFPQNDMLRWNYYLSQRKYAKNSELKNEIHFLVNKVLSYIIPVNNPDQYGINYERNTTTINEHSYNSDFYFAHNYWYKDEDVITTSDFSDKITTVKLNDRLIVTTCNIMESEDLLRCFVNRIIGETDYKELPSWIFEYKFYNDRKLLIDRDNQNRVIEKAEETIAEINRKISQNNRYKTILYTNGTELASVVFELLELILKIDLKGFIDNFDEDFLFEKEGIIFIGEIKGVSSNVKMENISQLLRHYTKYIDDNPDIDENRIRKILIINPLRKTPLSEREKVYERQIAFAQNNNCLIIETVALLHMFEKVLSNELSTEDCLRLLADKTGLLKLEDLNKGE